MQTVSSNRALCGTATTPVGNCTAPCGTTAPAVSFQVDSQTTPMGHRSHTVTTRNHDLALSLYEQALQIDIEPDFTQSKGLWTVGFICADSERDAALLLALAPTSASEASA